MSENSPININPAAKRIVFTGGGSAGHVTPNIAIIDKLLKQNWQISYIGSNSGIERELITKLGVPYFAIFTGKLRRYFSWQNFIDPLKIICGMWQAFWLCCKLRPQIIFSKGGFVSFPVVVAGWILRIPVILHESDLSPGLANKLCFPFAHSICLTFADSSKYFNRKYKNKIVITGTPIRESLWHGNAAAGLAYCGFNQNKKVILIFGGSLGADNINKVIRQSLPKLLTNFQIVHITGNSKMDNSFDYPQYKQFTYLHEEFADVMAAADIVISRSGANSVYELLTLKKPHIFIPLSKKSSRGDQIDNALHFAKTGVSQVILEENFTPNTLIAKIQLVTENYDKIMTKLQQLNLPDSCNIIIEQIKEHVKSTCT